MINSKLIFQEIISKIDSEKKDFALGNISKEEAMNIGFAQPLHHIIESIVFDSFSSQKKFGFNQPKYEYYDLLISDQKLFDFAWCVLSTDKKEALIKRFFNSAISNLWAFLGSKHYAGFDLNMSGDSTLLKVVEKRNPSNMQIKQFCDILQKKFSIDDMLEIGIDGNREIIISYIVNGSFYDNFDIVDVYNKAVKTLNLYAYSVISKEYVNASSNLSFILNLNALVYRNEYIFDSEWKRIERGEGFLNRRMQNISFVMNNGSLTDFIYNEVKNQGFDSLKISYISNINSATQKYCSEEQMNLITDNIIGVISTIKTLVNVNNRHRYALSLALNRKPSIMVPLLSNSSSNMVCKDLLKNHFKI